MTDYDLSEIETLAKDYKNNTAALRAQLDQAERDVLKEIQKAANKLPALNEEDDDYESDLDTLRWELGDILSELSPGTVNNVTGDTDNYLDPEWVPGRNMAIELWEPSTC